MLAAGSAWLLAAFGTSRWWYAASVAAVALMWALTLAPTAFPNVRVAELFGAWELKNVRVEEGREMYGCSSSFTRW